MMARQYRPGRPKRAGAKVVAKIRRKPSVAYGDNWEVIKQAVKKRDSYKCRLCPRTTYLQVDHIIPVSKGGRTIMPNLWTLCDLCHSNRPGHKCAKNLILHKRNSEEKNRATKRF